MRTRSCLGFRSLIALVAAVLMLPTVQAAEASSSTVAGVVLNADKLTIPEASAPATSTGEVSPHASLTKSMPRRALVSIKVWKACPAVRVESNCARYA